MPVAGLNWAPPGDYTVVVDSAHRPGGAFRLRFWVNDVTPPSLGRLRVSADARTLRVPVTDAGSGVDPRYLECALVEQGAQQTSLPARLGSAQRDRVDRRRAPSGRAATRWPCAPATTRSRATRWPSPSIPKHVRTHVIGLGRERARRHPRRPRRPALPSFDARRQVDGG